jgi:hypothetical protein
MWDDYSFLREGRPPLGIFDNDQLVFTPSNQIGSLASVGTVVGTISVISATPTFMLFVGNNPYFAISGSALIVKAPLIAGVFQIALFGVRGFKRLELIVSIVVGGSGVTIVLTPASGWTILS